MIKQILNPGEVVQTELAVDVNGTRVTYHREEDFSYTFSFYVGDEMTAEDCEKVIDEVVFEMEEQSYDHGAQWRETYRRPVFGGLGRYGTYSCRVYFRVRDTG